MTDSNHNQDPPSYDDINTPVVLLIGAISAVATLITIFFVQGLCYQWQNGFISRRDAKPTSMPAFIKIEEQKSHLTAESNKLSIDQAMTEVIETYK